MSVLPGFHRRGALRTAAAPFLGFTQQVDPAELPEPAELEAALVPYTLPAGHVGLHDVFAPHGSGPNVSDRWRRVIVARFIAADAELGESTYPDVRRRDFLDLRLRVSVLIGRPHVSTARACLLRANTSSFRGRTARAAASGGMRSRGARAT